MKKRRGRIGLVFGLMLGLIAPIAAQAASTITINFGTGSVTWTTSDFGVNEGATSHPTYGAHGDAYDGAIILDVCADATCTPNSGTYNRYAGTGAYDSILQTYTAPSSAVSGLTVTGQYRFSNTLVAGRLFASFQNTTGAPINRIIRVYSDLGSDGSTSLKYTSSNQTISNQTMPVTSTSNYWSISSQDSTQTTNTQTAADPVATYVFGTPGASVTPTSMLDNGYHYITYNLTVPANSTKAILFVFGLGEINGTGNTYAGALNGVLTYLDAYSKLPSDLVGDLTSTQIAQIQNWVIAPSPSSFTSSQSSPTKTTSAITYSMTMTQTITGLTGSDFSNAGTASGCTFTPDTSTGTTFTISVSSCGEGSLRPQLLANTVTGTQTGPSVDSPASTIIIIDRTAPTITSVTTTNGNYQATSNANMNFTVGFSESVTVTGTPRIPITIGSTSRYANFVSMTDSRTATFRYTVTVDYNDIDLDGISVLSPLETNTGIIADIATNEMTIFTFTPPTTTSVLVYQPPSAPTIDSITANNTSLTIYFTAGATNGSIVSNYKYSLNGGAFTALSPVDSITPITITGLTNGTTYAIQIKAVSNLGDGLASNTASDAPTASATVSIFLTASATTAVKGTTITITANVNQAGAVTFFWNSKRISGCIKKSATTAATCQWKPNVTGQWSIQALLDPADPTYVDSYSPKLPVFILRRSGNR